MNPSPPTATGPDSAAAPREARASRPRARRYPFVASIELTDLESETQVRLHTSDLSLFGCHIAAGVDVPLGAKIRIRIIHGGASFQALGKVAYTGTKVGMGIFFTSIESNDQPVLEKWISELRKIPA